MTQSRQKTASRSASDEPARRATSRDLIYLYGVLEAGTSAHGLLDAQQITGVEPAQPLFAIVADGLVAAVSRVPSAIFQEEPLNALVADLARLAPFAVRHEEAIQALAPHAPSLIPMTFGAIYRHEQRIVELLHQRGPEFRRLLADLRGKREWGLKVFRNTQELLAAAVTASPELRRLSEEAAAAAPGRAYLLNRRIEQLRARVAADLAIRMGNTIIERLSAISCTFSRDEPAAAQAGDVPLALKAAFLVEQDAEAAFRAAAGELAGACGPQGLHLEINGPWAPYSFVGANDASA